MRILRPTPFPGRVVAQAFLLMMPTAALAELSDESLAGPGAWWRPAYDGSASQVTELIPVVRYLGVPWFVRTTQDVFEGGVRVEVAPGLHAGAQLAYEPGRHASESGFLETHNVPDVDRGASAGMHVEWDVFIGPMPINLLVRARQNVALDRGAQVDLRLSAGVFRGGPVAMGVFGQVTWADAKSACTLYGITPQESLTTGLPAFQPGSGVMYTAFGWLGSVDLSSRWTVTLNLESHQLQGDTAHSPLAERRTNLYGSVGPAYRF